MKPITCGRCGRETVDGDCYGCEADRLRKRLDVLIEVVERTICDGRRHHHWDPTGAGGPGCGECQDAREAAAELRAVIEAAREETT